MSDRILMCAPDHFEIAYVINPWMEGNLALSSSAAAHVQWRALAQRIATVAQVDYLTPADGVPDMVFTANAGLVLGGRAILSRFRHAERQAEEPHFERWFLDNGFDVRKLPLDMWFEGAGDALFDPARAAIWLGHGHRSDPLAAPLVQRLLEVEVLPLRLVNERYYHLDTCLCVLEGGYLMYHPAAFDQASQDLIVKRVPAHLRIEVGADDAADFACNAVNCGRTIFLNRASAALVTQLQACGFDVQQTPLSEFMRAGGAAKCLTLKVSESVVTPPAAE
ncbi:MAG: dimethylarginine dimethylaminohydrolase family protein [Janthinobacterium lividum]